MSQHEGQFLDGILNIECGGADKCKAKLLTPALSSLRLGEGDESRFGRLPLI